MRFLDSLYNYRRTDTTKPPDYPNLELIRAFGVGTVLAALSNITFGHIVGRERNQSMGSSWCTFLW